MNPMRKYRKSQIPEGASRVFEGKIFDVYQWEQTLYDGSMATFERLLRPDTVMVFPVLPDSRILMIEDTQPGRDTILTVPSGRIEEGETPEVTARRELREETGYEIEALEPFFTLRPHSKIDWMVYGFIGKGAHKTTNPKPDSGEKITQRTATFDEFLSIVMEGKSLFRDIGHLVAEAVIDPDKMSELRRKFLG